MGFNRFNTVIEVYLKYFCYNSRWKLQRIMGRPPGLIEGKYRSCPHITIPVVQNAMFQLQKLEHGKVSMESTHCCIQCGFKGKLNDSSFRNHFRNYSHWFALRCSSPIELFCIQCNDYQYCSYLDKKTGRKRRIVGLTDEDGNSTNTGKVVRVNNTQPKGLLNMGATCFMNSVLQILCRTQALVQSQQLIKHTRDCVISNMGTFQTLSTSGLESSDPHSCIPCEFTAVCNEIHNVTGEPVIIPSNLLYAIWNFVDYMAGYAQQDAHEFLIAFLHSLDHQLQCTDLNEKYLFKDVYSGEVQSNLTCKNCGHSSITKEVFVDLSLSVDIDRAYQHINLDKLLEEESVSTDDRNTETEEIILDDVDIAECLHHFTALEEIKDKLFCDQCKTIQQKSKQFSIVKFPHMVIFHLKRFNFLDQKKITNKVNFPVKDFNLFPYMAKSRETMNPLDTNDNLFDLQGVVCHEGTLHQGHYISYVKDFATQFWLRCDDDDVEVVSEEHVMNAEAYLLFYIKK